MQPYVTLTTPKGPIIALQELETPMAQRFRNLIRIYHTQNHLCADDSDLYGSARIQYVLLAWVRLCAS